jgi:hypothetical protein
MIDLRESQDGKDRTIISSPKKVRADTRPDLRKNQPLNRINLTDSQDDSDSMDWESNDATATPSVVSTNTMNTNRSRVSFADSSSVSTAISTPSPAPSSLRSSLKSTNNIHTPVNTSTNLNPRLTQGLAKTDKPITRKRNLIRPHIYRHTLCIKTIKPRTEDDEQQLIQSMLQKFLETLLQADPTSIIPSYLDLERNDKSI